MSRPLDNKFHLDDNKIIKTSNGEAIPEDEPVFILRARDNLAVAALRAYWDLCVHAGCTDYQIKGVDWNISRFEVFAREHPERMKQPGITRGR